MMALLPRLLYYPVIATLSNTNDGTICRDRQHWDERTWQLLWLGRERAFVGMDALFLTFPPPTQTGLLLSL